MAQTEDLDITVKVTVTHRGTSNGNARGGSADRRKRREWLVQTYRSNVDQLSCDIPEWSTAQARGQHVTEFSRLPTEGHVRLWEEWGYLNITVRPTCRCYRCGTPLTEDTVTVDRIIPGCQGGTYRRDNIRPACGTCNSSTGGKLAGKGTRR